MRTKTFEKGLDVSSGLFQPRSYDLGSCCIAKQICPCFLDHQSVFQDFRLSLIKLRPKPVQSLRTVIKAGGQICHRRFLLADSTLPALHITEDGITFFFAATLLPLNI